MYQVLARKWRPATFEELVGQAHVARSLRNAIADRRLGHAYLFAGVRGTGKTTVARIFAKCLNCDSGPAPTPCGRCDSCTEIAEGRALDVLEIDAASRTKVDQTRELLELVSYAPVRDRHKILIIDEVHMLSKASFNALLKTLEEPPPSVVFVLATTEFQKILPTILSRCQIYEFRRVPPREVAGQLRKICAAEGIGASDAALERLARSGEGSVRDALSALERARAFCGDAIDDEEVLRLLGAVRADVLDGLVRALAARDAGAMLTVLDGLVDDGHDLVHFWSELISALRDLLLLRALPARSDLLGRSEEEARGLERAATGLSREDLGRAFQVLADLEPGLKASSQPRFLFEATLIRLASLGAVRPIEEFLTALEGGGAVPLGATARPPETVRPPTAPPKKKAVEPSGGDLLARIGRAAPLVGAILEEARSLEVRGQTLHIRLGPGSDALKRRLEEAGCRELVGREAAPPGAAPLAVSVEVDRQPPPAAAGGGSAPGTGERGGGGARPVTASLLERIRSEPGVGKLFDTFGAQVVDVRALDGASPEPGDDDAELQAPAEER